ncbi:MAG: methyltransferase domain-containing protein [Gemmataceae bacterium]
MNRAIAHLRLFGEPGPVAPPPHDPLILANRELIRPPTHRRGHHRLEPFSPEWYAELEAKRYSRHGRWLESALEIDRHPGEPILLLNPGVGSDALRFLDRGNEVALGIHPEDDPRPLRENLARRGHTAEIAACTPEHLPFADGRFDVVVFDGLHDPVDPADYTDELFRVLKCGGKVIGLFPARYDAGYWQDLLLPLQHWYWRRPADPTSAAKRTARDLRRAFHRFTENKVFKRHLRRSELPHLIRLMPLVLLERVFGRVLVLKARKPISAARVLNELATVELSAA